MPSNKSFSDYHTVYNNTRYISHGLKLEFWGSRFMCLRLFNNDLASIHSTTEQTDARDLCDKFGSSTECYIGMINEILSFSYWTDGSLFNENNICGASRRPSEELSLECMVLRDDLGDCWDDLGCWTARYSICNKNNITYNDSMVPEVPFVTDKNSAKYVFIHEYKTYSEANALCQQNYGTTLASIHSEEDQIEAALHCESRLTVSCWIGLKRIDKNHEFMWEDNTALDYQYNSTTFSDTQHCIRLWDNGGNWWWATYPCDSKRYILCNMPSGSTYLDVDSNNIVISNNNNFIAVKDMKLEWSEGRFMCLRLFGTELASITTASLQMEASDLCHQFSPNNRCWIGLKNHILRHSYWSDNTHFDYVNWNAGQPDNSGGNDDCVEITSSQKWSVAQCWTQLSFICNYIGTKPPSNAPTIEPTKQPTISPTATPSESPLNNPTASPSYSPSISPTSPPTAAPTAAPSNSPTACMDFYPNYNSLDGMDYTVPIHSEKHVMYNKSSFPPNAIIQTYISSGDHYFYDENIECDDINADICFIGCNKPGHCAKMSITPIIHPALKEIELVCGGKKACDEARINLNTTDTHIDRISILCTDILSCAEGSISINASDSIKLSLECFDYKSCQDLSIQLMHGSSDVQPIYANISCYDAYSCDNMIINTDNSRNILIYLNAFRYSDNIEIVHAVWENIDVQCGSDNDRRFIRYNNKELLEESEILQLARDEYSRTKRLPCEDIHIICTANNSDFYQDCTYKYDLNFSLSNLLSQKYRPNCYWLEIGQLYLPKCSGTCGDKLVYTQYNKTFVLNVIFNSNTTESYQKCDKYFGSTNDTEDSLSSIDAVFGYVLNIIANIPNSILHDVLFPPDTALREEVYCTMEDKNEIKITTDVTIEADDRNGEAIDSMFDPDGQFINTSAKLLSELFGIPITLEEVSSEINVIKGVAKWIVYLIVIVAAFCLIAIIVFLLRRWYILKKQIIHISKPMVIALAIRDYYDDQYRDLNGIGKDIKNFESLCSELNYELHSKYTDKHKKYPKMAWKQNEIIDFLQKKAKYFDKAVRENMYDGLIVAISSHGVIDHIVSSDGLKIEKRQIHRTFSKGFPDVRCVPRIFMFDSCEGGDDKNHDWRETEEGKGGKGKSKTNVLQDIDDEKKCDDNINRATTIGLETTYNEWNKGEYNPDYLLCTIFAANAGFQAKMDALSGSYLITEFVDRMKENIESGNKLLLGQIFDNIQKHLHDKGKQLVEFKCNNGTRFVKLHVNNSNIDNNNMIQYEVDTNTNNNSNAVQMVPISNHQNKGYDVNRFDSTPL